MSGTFINIGGHKLSIGSDRPPIGIPTLWMTTKPDWAIDFGNGASTKYLWANYPALDTADFRSLLTSLATGGWMTTAYDADGFYVPDLRGIVPIGYGTNAIRTGETTAGGNLGAYSASQNKYHNHGFTGSAVTSTGMSANASHTHNLYVTTDSSTGSGTWCVTSAYVLSRKSVSTRAAISSTSVAHTHNVTASGSVGYNGTSGAASKPATIGCMWIVRFE